MQGSNRARVMVDHAANAAAQPSRDGGPTDDTIFLRDLQSQPERDRMAAEAAEYGESTDAHDVDQFRRRSAAASARAAEKEQEEKAKQVFILPTFAKLWHISSCFDQRARNAKRRSNPLLRTKEVCRISIIFLSVVVRMKQRMRNGDPILLFAQKRFAVSSE